MQSLSSCCEIVKLVGFGHSDSCFEDPGPITVVGKVSSSVPSWWPEFPCRYVQLEHFCILACRWYCCLPGLAYVHDIIYRYINWGVHLISTWYDVQSHFFKIPTYPNHDEATCLRLCITTSRRHQHGQESSEPRIS